MFACAPAQVRHPETVEVANFLMDKLGKSAVTAELLQPDELARQPIPNLDLRLKVDSVHYRAWTF